LGNYAVILGTGIAFLDYKHFVFMTKTIAPVPVFLFIEILFCSGSTKVKDYQKKKLLIKAFLVITSGPRIKQFCCQ